MSDRFAVTRHDNMLLESESLTQPLDCGWRIAIPQARYYRRSGILRETGHDISFLIWTQSAYPSRSFL
jgi:hypothetical protein